MTSINILSLSATSTIPAENLWDLILIKHREIILESIACSSVLAFVFNQTLNGLRLLSHLNRSDLLAPCQFYCSSKTYNVLSLRSVGRYALHLAQNRANHVVGFELMVRR